MSWHNFRGHAAALIPSISRKESEARNSRSKLTGHLSLLLAATLKTWICSSPCKSFLPAGMKARMCWWEAARAVACSAVLGQGPRTEPKQQQAEGFTSWGGWESYQVVL